MMETQCTNRPKISMIVFAKKGMARKAMVKNLTEGNTKKLANQITNGTVKIIK